MAPPALPGAHASSWGAPGSQLGPSSTRGRPCPVPRAVTICRGGARPQRSAVVPGWSRGPPALLVERGHAPGGRRAGCVASTPAWEHPCLNLNTFILTANKQRTVFVRLSQSCRLSPLGSRGSRLCPFFLLVEAEPLFLSSYLNRGAEGVLDSIYKP